MRFPEFTGEWENITVTDLLQFYSTNSLSWEQLSYEDGQIYNLHYGLIHKGLPTIVDLEKDALPYIANGNEPRNYTSCKSGDIAFADASEDTNDVGKAIEFVNVEGKNIVCGLHTIHGRDLQNKTVAGFKGYAFASQSFHNQIRRIAQGTKVFSISGKSFDEVYIGIPTKDEQKKIARLMQIIDDRIATQNKIIEDLKKLKSAIIEESFSTNEKKVLLSSLLVQQSIRNRQGMDLKVLSVSNKYGFIAQSEQFEDREIASEDTSNYKVVSKGMFAYNPARINVGSIALYSDEEQGIVSPMYVCFSTKKQLLPLYLKHFLSSNYFQYEMYKRLEGSVRLCLVFDGLCNIQIPLPDTATQQHIADRIDSIDAKIQLELKLLSAYNSQRSFLLSQMFI